MKNFTTLVLGLLLSFSKLSLNAETTPDTLSNEEKTNVIQDDFLCIWLTSYVTVITGPDLFGNYTETVYEVKRRICSFGPQE